MTTLKDLLAKCIEGHASEYEYQRTFAVIVEQNERLRDALQWVNDEVDMGDGSAKYVKEALSATDPAKVLLK